MMTDDRLAEWEASDKDPEVWDFTAEMLMATIAKMSPAEKAELDKLVAARRAAWDKADRHIPRAT